MRTYFGIEAPFANPYSGKEKGNVERKVYWCRQHLITPEPRIEDIAIFSAT
ncbi:hypothetical protein [Slackia exigua]|uniref:hypothetical protein n=1 Tax=Slackia exigua TaxID=84109 RepID=UPI00210B9F74|nr:hypothetical protein [Slackia exigua]MCQ5092411.1 hypothetical protein [Slackia exigua]